MSEEQDLDTRELQETLDELHEERREREAAERSTAWTRYVALTTALLAVFAAVGALQSGSLANEAMIAQLRASDTWTEYQADRQKDHMYSLQANALLDSGAHAPPAEAHGTGRRDARAGGRSRGAAGTPRWQPLPPDARVAQYVEQADREGEKERELMAEAGRLERESRHQMHLHHAYAGSVALIQVAIALSAVAALTRMRWVWVGSLLVGLAGVGLFAAGLVAR